MSVAELIAALSEMPPDALVRVGAESGPGQMSVARTVCYSGRSVQITGDEPDDYSDPDDYADWDEE